MFDIFGDVWSTSKLSTVFLLLLIGQFPFVVFLYRTQVASESLTSYTANADYYKTLTGELTGSLWEELHNSDTSSVTIQFVKRAVQEFVRNLEGKDEGIKDDQEYEGIVQDLTSFLQQKVTPKL